jgi:hypothetical protein
MQKMLFLEKAPNLLSNRVPGTIAGVFAVQKLGSLPIEAILKPVVN